MRLGEWLGVGVPKGYRGAEDVLVIDYCIKLFTYGLHNPQNRFLITQVFWREQRKCSGRHLC